MKKWPWLSSTKSWSQRMPNGEPWPRLTVITPSFNQGRFIEETIRSVLQQGYPNLEYIIIDAGSTDGTVEVIRKYETQLAYWVSEPDRGQSDALNKGLSRATGDIVGWINSDDMYTKDCFRKVVSAFVLHPESIVVHGDRILLDENSLISGWSCPPAFDPNVGWGVCSETAFWRRSATRDISFKTELQFAMDLEFFCRLQQKGEFLKLNRFLGYFRCYAQNKSSTMQDVCKAETEEEWDAIYGPGAYKLTRVPPTNRCFHAAKLIQNPLILAAPYLYRRFIFRRRATDALR